MSSLPPPTSRPVDIDYAGLFAAAPSPYLVLTPELVICDVNEAYLRATRRTREELIGRAVFEAFPDNPDDPSADGVRSLRASLERARATGRPDSMAVQKYDIRIVDEHGETRFEERYWSPTNTPVLDRDGRTILLIHHVEDVTDFVLDAAGRGGGAAAGRIARRGMQAEIAARARELHDANRRLREINAVQREIALELQDAMLPVVEGAVASSRTAVRYRPALGSLKVCGDWYDVADLGEDRIAMAVGDVVGHGLSAASLMGQLRAALVAATRATGRPDRALDVLDAYARTLEEAVGTTAVKVVVDLAERTLTYSVAGHPPPILLRGDGRFELLDQATGPPLAATPEPIRRPMARAAFAPGDLLVLYTDGLVERREESLARGIERLAATARRHAGLGLERAADAILAELTPEGEAADDVALVLVSL